MKIVQREHYKGEDWWEWSVWLDGSARELESVEKVVWRLHPTFRQRVRESRDRAAKFRLDTSGWGTFRIGVDVQMKDGSVKTMFHDLELTYPDGTINDD